MTNGYPKIGTMRENGQVVECPQEMKMLRRLYDYVQIGGLSFRRIADQLEKEGFRGRTGRPITATMLARYVQSKAYRRIMEENRDPITTQAT